MIWRMPTLLILSFPSTATVRNMFFRFESAAMSPAIIVLSTHLGFPRKCSKTLFSTITSFGSLKTQHYWSFYKADCSGCPSREPNMIDEAMKKDRDNNSSLVKARVRAIISCEECKKTWCIYMNSRLSSQEEVYVQGMKEANTYTCGSPSFQMYLLFEVLFW